MLNFYGIIIAFASFFVIGIFHPIVIKGEYYFSEKNMAGFSCDGNFILRSFYFYKRNCFAFVRTYRRRVSLEHKGT